MVLVVKDRIKDTSTTSGTGTITLANSPPNGFQAFSTLGNNSTTYYAIQDANDAFEIGLGTYNANTLTRTTILASSNSGNLVNLTSGPNTVWVDYPAAKAYLSEEGIDKSFTATASITAGKPVILNSAGTVTQVAETTSDAAPGVGTALTLDSSVNGSDSRTVLVYMDGIGSGVKTFLKIFCDGGTSNHITAIAFTISDTGARTITAGTPVVVTSNDTAAMDAVFDPDTDRVIMVYRNGDASNQAYYSVISVSGTTVTASTVATLDNNNSIDARDLAITYDTSADRVAVVYYDQGDSGKIRSYVGTVTGGSTNSVAWGSNVEAEGAASNVFTRLCYDIATNRHLLVWRNDSGLQSKVGTLTGSSTNTLAWGSTTTLNSTSVFDIELPMLAYEATQEKCVLGWFSGSSTQKFGVVTVTGASTNTAAIGSLVSVTIDYVLHEPNSNALSAIAASKVAYVYNVSDTVKVVPFTISGTSLSAGTAVTVASADTSNIQIAGVVTTGAAAITFETNNVSINAIEYRSAAIPGGGPTVTNLTSSNYLGVASTSAGANASVNINIPGSINNDQTGLTIGRNYYTSSNGVISTTLSPNFVGRAISSTQLLLEEKKGNSLDGFSNGAITKGKPVVMQADGDVAQAKETSSSITFAQGSATELEEGWIDQRLISYDVNENKFLVTYRDQDNSSHGYCKVLSVSGTTVSYGSQSSAFNSSSTNIIDSVYDPESGNHVIFYQNGSSQYGYGVVASISGTSVTFGTPVAFNSANTHYRGTCYYDSTNKKVVWVGGAFESGAYALKSIVATVSGTSITFGTISDSGVSSSDYYSSAYDTNSSIGVYAYSNSSSDGYIGTLSISGTSITWNTPVNFNGSDNVQQKFDSMGYDSVNKKIVHFFKDSGTSSLQAIVGTVSGTSISFGTKVQAVSTADGGNTDNMATIGTLQGVMALVYRDARSGSGNGYLRYLQGTVSGTSISFAGGVLLDGTNTEESPAIAYDSNNYGIVTSYSDISTHDLWALAVTPSGNVVSGNLTATNYLGIASDTVANNENATIQTQGAVNPDQSNLTAGQLYYVQTDGTLSTTAGSPSVIAGIATSATTLLVTKS